MVWRLAWENSGAVLAGIAQHRSQAGLIMALLQLAGGTKKPSGPPDIGAVAKRAKEILNDGLFDLFARNNLRGETEQMIREYLSQLFAYPDAQAFWRRDIESIIRTLADSTVHQEYIFPDELCLSHPPAERMAVLKSVVAGYFDLIAVWPALWSAAVKLRENQNVTPARKLGQT